MPSYVLLSSFLSCLTQVLARKLHLTGYQKKRNKSRGVAIGTVLEISYSGSVGRRSPTPSKMVFVPFKV